MVIIELVDPSMGIIKADRIAGIIDNSPSSGNPYHLRFSHGMFCFSVFAATMSCASMTFIPRVGKKWRRELVMGHCLDHYSLVTPPPRGSRVAYNSP